MKLGDVDPEIGSTHLVRQSQGQLDLVVDGLGVTTALDGSAEEGGTSPQGRASEAEGVHFAMVGRMQKAGRIPLEGCGAKVEVGAPVVP